MSDKSDLVERVCPECGGEGGLHLCGFDPCECDDPEELTDECAYCEGEGVVVEPPEVT